VPILVTILKKKVKYEFDENKNIHEKTTLKLNFTVDERFLDAEIGSGFCKDVNY
jgi:hypothetical protein